ncbi:hypothetical protein MKK88_15265 [Methylobacterium sp. E-005]|uniref:hypothetical protein n=1 Tax=Methylobacterium sp. E-005 TaxID=2836549 RepID=UPI001FB8A2C6|nr:hypothetical protein [Methylobacterium sp. E-005]MCJ2087333.1 hypothetical protein [Methylobacterium sp. E-005]
MAESVIAESVMAESVDDAPARDAPELDWAGIVAATPEPDGVPAEPGAVDTVLSLAKIGALSPEQRLALFA